jgi:multicomponent Na+:H+ antiporter subunit A
VTALASWAMFGLLGLHVVAAATAPALASRIGKRVLLVVAIAPAATTVWALAQLPAVLEGGVLTENIAWAPGLGFELTLRLDAFALLMVLIIAGIGVAVFVYAFAYFRERADMGRLSGMLVAFAAAMLGLVLADNVIALFLFWELTSVLSYLLIGLDDRSATARWAPRGRCSRPAPPGWPCWQAWCWWRSKRARGPSRASSPRRPAAPSPPRRWC